MKNIIKILLLFFFITSESQANENLNNKILKNLRCLVCQGQTVQDSNSEFALIIKSVVKDKIKEGNNEKEIICGGNLKESFIREKNMHVNKIIKGNFKEKQEFKNSSIDIENEEITNFESKIIFNNRKYKLAPIEINGVEILTFIPFE